MVMTHTKLPELLTHAIHGIAHVMTVGKDKAHSE